MAEPKADDKSKELEQKNDTQDGANGGQLTEGEQEQARAEEQAGLEAGFAEASGDAAPADAKKVLDGAQADGGKTDSTGTAPGKGAAKPAAAAPAQAAAATADPNAEVSPGVKRMFEELSRQVGEAVRLGREASGRVGAMQSAMQKGQAAAQKAGAEQPSQADVAVAFSDPKAWEKFKEEFPEFAGPLEPEIKALHAAIKQAKDAGKPVDVDALKEQFVSKTDLGAAAESAAEAAGQRAEERAFLRMRHPEWKSTANSPEFKAWMFDGGPTEAQWTQMKTLEKTDPAKAQQMQHGFAVAHPQWWGEKGASIFSESAEDAIKVFDSYAVHTQAKTTAANKGGDPKARQQQRLAAAAAPRTGAAAARSTSPTEEEAFLDVFKPS